MTSLGIPFQIIVGSKTQNDQFEFKEIDKDSQMLDLNKIVKTLENKNLDKNLLDRYFIDVDLASRFLKEIGFYLYVSHQFLL